MKEGVDVQYYRSPNALVLHRRFLTNPQIFIKVSRQNGCAPPHNVLGIAQQILMSRWDSAELYKTAMSAVLDYKSDDTIVPPGCRKCPIHMLAAEKGAQRVCQGFNEQTVEVYRPAVSSTNQQGISIESTLYSCKGYAALGLSKRQVARLHPDTQGSLEEQLRLLPQASCVLLPELT